MSTTATEPEFKRAVPAWRRSLVAVCWLLSLLVVVSAAVYLFNRHRLHGQLERVMKELDETDPGWRWEEVLAARREIPEEENAATRLLAIVRDLPPGWPDCTALNTLEEVAPNRVLDGPRQQVLDGVLAVPPMPALRVKARELARYPRGRFDITFAVNPRGTPLPDHVQVQSAAYLLFLDAHALSLAGRHAEALQAARACLYVSRAVEDDPFSDGNHNRFMAAELSMSAAEQAMARGDAPDGAVAAYQDALRHEASRTGLVTMMRGERASMHKALRQQVAGMPGMGNFLHDPAWDAWGLGWTTSVAAREVARREHVEVLTVMTRVVEAAKLPAKDQFAAEDDIEKEVKSLARGVLMRKYVPAFRATFQAARRAQCQAVALRALIAVERYRLKHGKWPAKWEDTVPAFLDRVPLDPIDEKPIRYARWAEGVVVYSIGNDRKDGGGDVPLTDFGYRLWDKEKRRAALP